MKIQFLKLSHELITDKKITSNEFRIYTYLMSRYNKDKSCAYPSMEIIAERVNISLRTVKSAVKNLVNLGYMAIEKKKGINGNYNQYKGFKFLVEDKNKGDDIPKEPKKTSSKQFKPQTTRKSLIVSDFKESGIQIGIEELISPYTKEHEQKISLVLKQNVNLTEKQLWLLGEMDIEVLKEALRNFRKDTKTNKFTFLIDCYYSACAKYGVEPSLDIQRYCHKKFIVESKSYLENKETEQALRELELYGVPYIA